MNNKAGYWSDEEGVAFAQAIERNNIIAIVHGHTHSCNFYKWGNASHEYDVFNAPALQKGGAEDPSSTPSQVSEGVSERAGGWVGRSASRWMQARVPDPCSSCSSCRITVVPGL